MIGKVPHFEVTDGETDDGGLVQLASDGSGQREHLGQLVKLKVLLSPSGASRIAGLFFTQGLQATEGKKRGGGGTVGEFKEIQQGSTCPHGMGCAN